jgi:prevent-host-death family protein
MHTVNIHEAKTHLSHLVELAAGGEPFIIAKAGKPLVKVTAIAIAAVPKPRIGFMKGRLSVPENFDELGAAEISDLFRGS